MTLKEILKELKSQKNEKNVAGMMRFGIQGGTMLGISMPILRKMAKDIKKISPCAKASGDKATIDHHQIALELWDTGIHEAKILASMVDEPEKVTAKQMDNWIKDFDSWDVCDQVCMNLFDKTEFAFQKCLEWSSRKPEFEKRAGFALMAAFAWHRRDIDDKKIAEFFPYIIKESTDGRNYVKKAVNWALRQIGKRSVYLKKEAIKAAEKILRVAQDDNSKTARWIANDAIRELENKK